MSCAACGTNFKGHTAIEVRVGGVKRFFACPAALNDARNDRDEVRAELVSLRMRLTDAARINEQNGMWKRTQQVVKYLREKAARSESPAVAEALNAAASQLELHEDDSQV